MKRPQKNEWATMLEDMEAPDQQVDVPALLSLLQDERAKHLRVYARNALAFCIKKFIDNPGLPQSEQDFYRGAALAYKGLMNLKAEFESQVSNQMEQKKRAATTGSAGY